MTQFDRALGTAAVLGLAVVTACGGVVTGPDPADDPASVFESAWREIDHHYSFFEYNRLDWNAAYARYRPMVTSATTPATLRTTLCAMVADLQSYHASLTTPTGTCGRSSPAHAANYDAALVRRVVRAPLASTRSGRIQYATLASDIGYVYIGTFDGQFGDEIENVLAALADVRALVIDIRNNTGGNDGNGASIAARFTTERRVYELTRYRNGPAHDAFTSVLEKVIAPAGGRHFGGPVALITNYWNGSAAEDFIMMMRVIPAVITVGDTTLGNSSNPLLRELPNGWALRVPQSIQMTPAGFIVEGHGLPATYPVLLDSADAARGVDTILDVAIRELRRRM